jgi:hypothetical protein
MYQGSDFELFATDELGWSYFINSSNQVQRQFQPRPVRDTPSNFNEMELKWGRSFSAAGLQQSYSTASNFIGDLGKIIRYITYTHGSEGVLKFTIYKLNKQFGMGMIRELFFSSEFDLSKFDRQQDHTASMLMEGDPEKTFKAKENTEFEIDVTDDPDAVDVLLDGIVFAVTATYKSLNVEVEISDFPVSQMINDVAYVTREGITGTDVLYKSSSFERIGLLSDPATLGNSSNWFFGVPLNFSFHIKGTFSFKYKSGVDSGSVDREIGVKLIDSLGNVIATLPQAVRTVGTTYTLNYDLDVAAIVGPFAPGTRRNFFIVTELLVVPTKATVIEFYEHDNVITFDYRYRPDIRKALTPETLATRILTKIFGYAPTLQSNLFTVDNDLLFTCGDEVRGLDASKIKISWAKFFKFIHMRYCAGYDLLKDAAGKAIMVVEKRTDFFKDEETFNAGDAVTFTDTIAEEYLFNELHIGYPDQEYAEVNGRGEFNVTHKYSTPIKRTIKTLDLLTELRADMLGIEITRINLQNKTTTDSNSDNDTFVLNRELTPTVDLDVSPDPYYKLDRSVNASVTGLIHPASAFNVKLSPKTCLYNHAWYIRSCLYYQATGKVTYQTSDKNAEMQYTDDNGKVITEKADINIASLGAPVFMPHVLNVSTASTENIAGIFTPKPKGYVKYAADGRNWKGFPIEITIKPVTEEEQVWKLLAKADNDMKKLI